LTGRLEFAVISAENADVMKSFPAAAPTGFEGNRGATDFARVSGALGVRLAHSALAAVAVGITVLWPALSGSASAQTADSSSLFSATPSMEMLPPNTRLREGFAGSRPPVAGPIMMPTVPAGQSALALSARFGKDAPAISGGLTWRVYAAKPDAAGTFKLIKEDKSAAPTLVLPAGPYIVNVGFGLATAVKPVTLRGPTLHEEFDLPAGGLRIQGHVGDALIPAGQISFDVYKGSQFEAGDRRPIAEHIATGAVVVVPEGTYYIVSNYGDANSLVRSDIRVQAGKLTDITVNHRAAIITLKLVTQKGGEALANTAWSVLTPGGDVIKESIGAFPRVVLAEGEYRAIARNEGKVYEREFKVVTGVDGDVEVLAK
jgi:hypothetical protein